MTDAGDGTRPEPLSGTRNISSEFLAKAPSWPGVTRPAGWFLPQEPADEAGYDEDQNDADRPGGLDEDVAGQWFVAGESGSTWYEDDDDEYNEDDGGGGAPVVGPTSALRGRPGGPGFAIPPGTIPGLSDQRSPWEQSQDAWVESGVQWERGEAQPPAEPDDYRAPSAFGRRDRQNIGWGAPAEPQQAGWPAPDPGLNAPLSAPTMAAAPPVAPPYIAPPNAAPSRNVAPLNVAPPNAAPLNVAAPPYPEPPTVADAMYTPPAPPMPSPYAPPAAQAPERPYVRNGQYSPPASLGWPTRSDGLTARSAGPDDGDPWQSTHPHYLPKSSRSRKVRRRRGSIGALQVGVPVLVIVAVGAVAVMMLTGRTPTTLADRSNQTAPAAKAKASAMGSPATGSSMTMTTFPGYPGKAARSPEFVDGIAADGTTVVAVGTVDGYPAAWQRGANGAWILTTGAETGRGGTYALTSVAEGNGGWVAVGGPTGTVGSGGSHPVVLASADGRNWQVVDGEHSFSYQGESIYAAAAGPEGYVVVGQIHEGDRTHAADWWSTNLRDWTLGGNGGLDGRLASSKMLAVAATPGGFVAVGQHAGHPAAWMAANAPDWMVMDLPIPAGASSASLTQVVSHGDQLVAAGEAYTSHGTVPFAAVSGDGGSSWSETMLSTVGGGSATVTALTASPNEFVAAGMIGHNVVYWTSRNGTDWTDPTQLNGDGGITSLTATSNGTITGISTMNGHPALVTIP